MTLPFENEKNFHYFYEISRIPRGSFHEEKIADYIEAFAEERGLAHTRDALGNILIKKPGSPGREQEPALILQAHTDMVWNRDAGNTHDFLTEPIDVIEEDGWLTADGTTLGADDGAGVANLLAVLSEEDLSHPPLECILTVQEEDGMGGAKAVDLSSLTGKRMIGLDGVAEGETIYSGSAVHGVQFRRVMNFAPASSGSAFTLSVTGLTSGHGANCIGKEGANAVKVSAEILRELERTQEIRLVSLDGGGLIHVIPGACRTVFLTDGNPGSADKKIAELKSRYAESDPGMKIEIANAEFPEGAATLDGSRAVIRLLYLLPACAIRRDPADLSFVRASCNLSIVRLTKERFTADLVCRANEPEDVERIYDLAAEFGDVCGIDYATTLHYAGFCVPTDAPLVQTFAAVYKEGSGKDLRLTRIHSGLDAGEICSKLGIRDFIVVMPDTPDVHTTKERMNIESFRRTYGYLKKIIERA